MVTDASDPPEPRPRGKRGPPKGTRGGGRAKGTKNRATIERERKAQLEADRLRLLEQAAAQGGNAVVAAEASGRKLMKEIAFDLAYMFAGLAGYYQPFRAGPNGERLPNPNFVEAKFVEYGRLAATTALGAAPYESPRLSAVMIAGGVVEQIQVVGGLPDTEDGGLVDAPDGNGTTIDLTAELESGAFSIGGDTRAEAGAGGAAVPAPGAAPAVPGEGQA